MDARDWLDRLDEALEARSQSIDKFENYYNGDHDLTFTVAKWREAFGDLLEELADNWMQLCVDIPVDRLKIDGFDVESDAAHEAVAEIWADNNLDSESLIAHTEAVKCGIAYLMVSPPWDGDPRARVTIEHASQAIVECAPDDRMNRLAGLKKWDGRDGFIYANVYLPEAVYKFRAKTNGSGPQFISHDSWEPIPGQFVVDNPLGVVPLIPLRNNPTAKREGVSDLECVIPLQDAINKQLSDMLIASDMMAFPQRVLLGVEVPKYPKGHERAGQPVDDAQLVAAMSRIWMIEPNEDGTLPGATQFQAADLSNYVEPTEMLVHNLATKTRIPPQMFLTGAMANFSAEAMDVAESGLIAKVERKQYDFTPAWREAMTLALKAKNIETSVKLQWKKPARQSIAQIADALVKLRDVNVPYEFIWSLLPDVTPEQIQEWLALRGLPDRAGDSQT